MDRFSIDSPLNCHQLLELYWYCYLRLLRGCEGETQTLLLLPASGGKLHFFVYFSKNARSNHVEQRALACSKAQHHLVNSSA